ncbi:uncharacterized protein LOC143378839 isoform X2 [Andrena cerasifolii]|uniref:uncharacterized protein LOC143378839 isoform X2 n=1 Tax=Andrena cerasifolii TaxID=2819439 RepID=UPI0040379BD8
MDECEVTDRYFQSVKLLAYFLGTWPHDKHPRRYIGRTVTLLMCFFGMVVQIMKVTKDFSFSAAAEQAPFIGTGFAAITKYVNTVLKVTKFAEILDEMKINLNAEKTDEEKSISHYYVKRAVLYGFLYKLNIYSGCVVFSVLPFVPKLLDLIKPLNESRPHIYIFPGYYFVDNDEYYNYILTFMIWNVYFVAMMFLGCDMIMIYLVQHACGLLAIAGYRFRHATDDVLPSQKGLRSSMHIKYRKLCLSIKSHNRAIEMINEIEKVYAVNLFLQVANATYLFSVTLLLVQRAMVRGACEIPGSVRLGVKKGPHAPGADGRWASPIEFGHFRRDYKGIRILLHVSQVHRIASKCHDVVAFNDRKH